MKTKFLLPLAALSMMSFAVSCSDDDKKQDDPDVPAVSNGIYVLNNGNMRDKIEGGVTFFDYSNMMATQDLFQKANKRSLGDTPQAAVKYGSKVYIGVYNSGTIEVVDANTFKSIKQISVAEDEANKPRSLVAKDGKVYVSMYTGYVARLDTATLTIDKTVKVGPNPDVIAICGDYLYTPDSDGMNWNVGYGTTASKIDLRTFTVTKSFEVPLNPTTFISNGSDLFLICKGDYNQIPSKVCRVNSDETTEVIAEANIAEVHDNTLYMINAPWGSKTPKYMKYDIRSGKISDLVLSDGGVEWPANIGVDPVNGNIIITSYVTDNGMAATSLPGYAKVYDANGKLLARFDTGVGPMAFFYKVK